MTRRTEPGGEALENQWNSAACAITVLPNQVV
jgi:hypothetical protein